MKKMLLGLIIITVFFCWAEEDFDAWLQSQNQEFDEWKNQQDKEFASFLEKGWEWYDTQETACPDSLPKPEVTPIYEEELRLDLEKGQLVDVGLETQETAIPKVADIEEAVQREQLMYAVSQGYETLKFSNWGLVFNLTYNLNMKIEGIKKCDNKSIADFWSKISNTDYEILHKDLTKMRNQFKFNDWAYCQLIYKTGKELYENDNMANLFTWFTLVKNGIDSKVGYDSENIFLLLASGSKMYGQPHLELSERDYYAVDLGNSGIRPVSLYTFEGKYPEADDLIDLNIKTSPYLKEAIVEKELQFDYEGITHKIKIRQNKNLVDFLASYPATDLEIYFGSDISPQLRESLITGLRPVLEGKPQAEALNIILRFVQTAFEYQTDEEQFGEENSLFPDETLYYSYCDCEDRSFLFSFLVNEFLDLEVIGLDYPGHIATAVNLDFEIEGSQITYNGKDFLVCDPTYINADIGMVMPQFAGVSPEVIEIR